MSWDCRHCGREDLPDESACPRCGTWRCVPCEADTIAAGLDACPTCGAERPGGRPQAATPPPPREQWQLTLPSHDAVPLVEGLTVGRATPGLIGATLQLFEHVHNEHVRLDVTGDALTVTVLEEKNPVFVYGGLTDAPWLDLGELPPGPPGLTLRAADGPRTLCLGQCCFIRLRHADAVGPEG